MDAPRLLDVLDMVWDAEIFATYFTGWRGFFRERCGSSDYMKLHDIVTQGQNYYTTIDNEANLGVALRRLRKTMSRMWLTSEVKALKARAKKHRAWAWFD